MLRRSHASRRGLLRAAVHVTAALLIGAVIIVWSWNTLAAELFAAPAMAFKHALAAELLVAMAIAVPTLWFHMMARREHAVRQRD